MITLTSWADLSELLDLMHEMIEVDGLDDNAAFKLACDEMAVFLELGPDARYAPCKFVAFDEAGRPGRYVLD